MQMAKLEVGQMKLEADIGKLDADMADVKQLLEKLVTQSQQNTA